MNNEKSERLIGSLALMKTELIEKDFISSYIPFVATALLELETKDDTIQIPQLLEEFSRLYGFTIDRAPMVTILNKCAKNGLVEKRRNGTYTIVKDACETKAISKQAFDDSQNKYSAIILKLKSYVKEFFQKEVTEEDAGNKFLQFLSENSVKTLTLDFDEVKDDDGLTEQQGSYIIGKFVLWAKDNDKLTYMMIKDIAVAYLMSSAIAYGENDEKSQIDAYKDLIIYLDTPFIFRLLGLNDESMQEADIALMDQLKTLNAKFRIFEHTLVEVENILKDCLKWINNEEYDEAYASPALKTFVKNKFTARDIQEYIDTLSLKLKYYRISVDSDDYYTGQFYNSQISEKSLEDAIVATYNRTFYTKRKQNTIVCDAKSIANVLKLWSGKRARTYKQITYLLLTTNTTLAFVTRNIPENYNSDYGIHPCVTVNYLGTNVWLSAPINKIENFSEKKLLADCAAIIHPSDKMIEKLSRIITKLRQDNTITEEQYYLLKSKAFEHDYLMNRTLSDETQFSDVIVEELLDEIEAEIKGPLQEQIKELAATNEQKEQENSLQAQELKRYQVQEQEQQNRIASRITRHRQKATDKIDAFSNWWVGFLVISVISIILALVPMIPIIPVHIKNLMLWGGIIIFIIALSFVVIMKTNFKGLRSMLETKLLEHYEKSFAKKEAIENLRK